MIDNALANWRHGAPRTILLATDWSARCDRPLDRAIQLAHYWGAWLIVLLVDEEADPQADRAAIEERIKERVFREMPSVDIRFHIDVRFGDVAARITEVANDHACDLIVTGVARHSPLRAHVAGTTVDLLIQQPSAPVLVVKKRPRFGYEKLLVATDLSGCLVRALAVLPAFPRARCTVVETSRQRPDEAPGIEAGLEAERGTLERAISSMPPDVLERTSARTIDGAAPGALGELVAAQPSGLLVLCRHEDDGGWLGPGNLGTLINSLDSDVLVVPPAAS